MPSAAHQLVISRGQQREDEDQQRVMWGLTKLNSTNRYQTPSPGGPLGSASGFGFVILYDFANAVGERIISLPATNGGYTLDRHATNGNLTWAVWDSGNVMRTVSIALPSHFVGKVVPIVPKCIGTTISITLGYGQGYRATASMGSAYAAASGSPQFRIGDSATENPSNLLSWAYFEGNPSDAQIDTYILNVRMFGMQNELPSFFTGTTAYKRWSVRESLSYARPNRSDDTGPGTIFELAGGASDNVTIVGTPKLKRVDVFAREGRTTYGAMGASVAAYLEGASIVRTAPTGYWFSLMATPYSIAASPTYRFLLDFERSAIYTSLGGQLVVNAQGGSVNAAIFAITAGMLGLPMVITGVMRGSTFEAYVNGISTGAAVAATETGSASILRVGAQRVTPPVYSGQDWTVHGYAMGRVAGGISAAEALAHAQACFAAGRMLPIDGKTEHYVDLTKDLANGLPAQVLDRIGTDHLTKVGGITVDDGALRGFSAIHFCAAAIGGGIKGTASALSFECLVYKRAFASDQVVMACYTGHSTGWYVNIYNNAVYFSAANTANGLITALPTPTLTDGLHHIAGTYDGTVARLYIDGVLAATSSSFAYLPANASSNMVFGAVHTGGAYAATVETIYGGSGSSTHVWTAGEIATAASSALANKKVAGVPGKTERRWSLVDDVTDAGGKTPGFVKERVSGADPMIVVGSPIQVAQRIEHVWSYDDNTIAQGAREMGTGGSYSIAGGYAGNVAGFTITAAVRFESVVSGATRMIAGKYTFNGAGWGLYTLGLNSTLYFSVGNASGGSSAPGYTIPAAEFGRIHIIQATYDGTTQKLRLHVKRAEVGTGTTWAQTYAPSANPMMIGHMSGGTGQGGISVLALGVGDGLATLTELQAQYDAIYSNDFDYVPIVGKTNEWWSFKRSLVGGALPATLPGQKGVYNLARTGTPVLDPVYARAAA